MNSAQALHRAGEADDATAPESSPFGHDRLRRRFVVAVLVLLALATIAVALTRWLLGARPAWWNDHLPAPQQLAAQAAAVEQLVTGELSAPRSADSSDWAIEITSEDANAWLADRLPKWIANQGRQWPAQLQALRVDLRPGRITIGAEVRSSAASRCVTAQFAVESTPGDAVLARLDRVSIGLIPAPADVVRARLRPLLESSDLRAQDVDFLHAILDGRPFHVPTTIDLDDGREVRIVDFELLDGSITLRCATERTAYSSE